MKPAAAAAKHDDGPATSGAPLSLYAFFTLVVFLGASGEGAARSFFNLYMDSALNISTAQIGAAMGFAQLLPVGFALVTPLFLARLGNVRTLMAATLAATFFIGVLALFPHWLAATAALMGIQATVAVIGPARSLFSQEIVPPHRRTTTAALAIVGMSLGWGVSAAFGGYIISAFGFRAFFLAIAALSASAALLLKLYDRRASRAPAQTALAAE
jgi:predicted MFS family arabinose efflux permease